VNKVAIFIVSLILATIAGLAGYTCTATAQSASKELKLEAYIIPAMDFTVDPDSIDFGAGGAHTVTLTNTGAWDLAVTCSATGPYEDGLKLNGEPWDLFNAIIKRGGYQEIDVELAIPENYTGPDASEAIIFWATDSSLGTQ